MASYDERILTSIANPINQVESPPRLLLFGLQHVLVMYAGTVAVPLILGSALHMTPAQIIALISADLFTSGLATMLQTEQQQPWRAFNLVDGVSDGGQDAFIIARHRRCSNRNYSGVHVG